MKFKITSLLFIGIIGIGIVIYTLSLSLNIVEAGTKNRSTTLTHKLERYIDPETNIVCYWVNGNWDDPTSLQCLPFEGK